MNFKELGLTESILFNLDENGYQTPTEIQYQAIPRILEGKDILGCAQTGTGKTAAFALPIIQKLVDLKKNEKDKAKIKALILTPTRELAIQIYDQFLIYGKGLGLVPSVIFGGVGQSPQVVHLRSGVDILIATPGRFLDLFDQGHIMLKNLEFFVLDEADRMLDMGFYPDIKKILYLIPEKRQSLFFSATMPENILQLAHQILKDPVSIEVTPVSSTTELVQQFLLFVDKEQKNPLLVHLLQNQLEGRVLVFCKTKHGADKIVKLLQKNQIKSEAIHGNKSQTARQNALDQFKNKKIKALVATDIAARGIDIDELEIVLNYDIPNISETYVHRIGRSGRAGVKGVAYSFCDDSERLWVSDIQKLIQKEIEIITDHPFPTALEIHRAPISKNEKKQGQPKKKRDFKKTGHYRPWSNKKKS